MDDPIQWQRIAIDRNKLEGLDCFPLQLTAMEKFFVWDEQPSYPKRFQIVVDCDGVLSGDQWIVALSETIYRHPMLVATIRDTDREWILPTSPAFEVAFIDSHSIEATASSPSMIADLLSKSSCRSGAIASNLRVAVVQGSDSTVLAFDVLHAACDGLGMRVFIEDATTRYNAIVQEDESLQRWKRLDYDRLKHRNECPEYGQQSDMRATTLREKLVHAYHFHFRGPYPVKSVQDKSARKHPLTFRSRELCDETTSTMREYLTNQSAGINEWAAKCILESISEWQKRSQLKALRSRLMVPIDLRVWEDLRLSACNKIGFAFVVNEPNSANVDAGLLASCKIQFEAIKKLCLGADFVRMFDGAKRFGWLVRMILQRSNCLATAVLTNLGDVTARQRKGRTVDKRSASGDLRLRAIYGWPPIRKGTQVGLGICRYDQRISIACVMDGYAFTEDEADEFFELLISKLIHFE